MSAGAVLLDIDGTLVDSNYLHIAAWFRGFRAVGEDVASSAVHQAIGMGAPQLLATLLGEAKAAALGDRVAEVHKREYAEARETLLRTLPGARELVREVGRRGAQAVLSTSASPEELQDLLRVLDLGDAVAAVTSAQDVETAKPDPGVVVSALDKAGVQAARAVYVGDTVWDVQAAGAAGVACVGVLTGGICAAQLRDAGAVATYDDAAHLLRELDDSPLATVLH